VGFFLGLEEAVDGHVVPDDAPGGQVDFGGQGRCCAEDAYVHAGC